jgi:hypothetical protein
MSQQCSWHWSSVVDLSDEPAVLVALLWSSVDLRDRIVAFHGIAGVAFFFLLLLCDLREGWGTRRFGRYGACLYHMCLEGS